MVANDAHLHLLLNHLPIVGGLLVTLLLVYALAVRSAEVTRAALILTVLIALVTISVNESGHDAEEVVEKMTGISEDMIEEHEERAEKAAVAMWVTGGFAFLGLLVARRGEVPRWVSGGTLALLLVSNGLMAWTGKAGGEIHHEEARAGFAAPEGEHGEHSHDEDTD